MGCCKSKEEAPAVEDREWEQVNVRDFSRGSFIMPDIFNLKRWNYYTSGKCYLCSSKFPTVGDIPQLLPKCPSSGSLELAS